LEASNVSLQRWVYFAREMDKGRAAEPIGEEIGVTRKTARRMAKTIRQALHAQRDEWLPKLSGEVETDDVHVKGGQQGRDVIEQKGGRAARTRGLSERGRGTYAGNRPLVVSWLERGGQGRVFELRRSAGHSEEYVSEEGAHCNTAEGEWSLSKPWWRRFRGIAKRYLYLYLSHHSFRRTYRDRSRIERIQAMIGFLMLGVFW